MNPQQPRLDDLDRLLVAMVERTIDEAGVRELERLLRADPAARLKYYQHISTHSALTWRYGAAQAEEEETTEAWGTVDSRILMEVIEEQARYNKEREAAEAAERAKREAARAGQQGGRMRLEPGDAMNIARDIVIPRSLLYLAAAACLALGTLLWIELTGPSRSLNNSGAGPLAVTPAPPDALPVVAQVRSSVDARWDGLEPGQDLLRADEQLTLAEGFAELELIDGARVVIEAPATFELTGVNAMRLASGKLVAYVPESAKGFEVATRAARIVDLGTEFGVNALPDGGLSAHVFEGEIRVHPGSQAAPSALVAGQAVEVDARGAVAAVAADEQAFVRPAVYAAIRDAEDLAAARWLSYTHKIRRDPTLLAYYSFDESTLVNGVATNMANATKGRFDAALGDGRPATVPLQTPDRFGQDSGALSFDPRNAQALYVDDWPQVGELDALTISCWFRLAEKHGRWVLLVTQWNDIGKDDDGRFSFHLGLRDTKSNVFGLQGHLSLDGSTVNGPGWNLKNPSPGWQTSPADGWVHVVFTIECGGGPVRMYRNGKEIDPNGAMYDRAHLPVINQPLAIGSKAMNRGVDLLYASRPNHGFFNGEIDDVALFRRALSPQEVKRMYQAGKPADPGPQPGLD